MGTTPTGAASPAPPGAALLCQASWATPLAYICGPQESIASNELVKAAACGLDPSWGRIACAAGCDFVIQPMQRVETAEMAIFLLASRRMKHRWRGLVQLSADKAMACPAKSPPPSCPLRHCAGACSEGFRIWALDTHTGVPREQADRRISQGSTSAACA